MTAFSKANRTKPLMHTVAFHGVPMFRGIALALDHIESHDAPVSIFSGDRRDDVLARFNRTHGTHLKGQGELIRLHDQDPVHNAAANPISQTSHCLRADATVAALLRRHGVKVNAGDEIPWFALGIDLSDKGKVEDCSHFLKVSRRLGYGFTQPYPKSRSEKHHVIGVESPVDTLVRWNVIPHR